MPNPFLVGTRVYLAPIDGSEEQVALNARWINDPEVTAHLQSGRFPLTFGQERDWVAAIGSRPDEVSFGIFLAEGDRYIGNCGLVHLD